MQSTLFKQDNARKKMKITTEQKWYECRWPEPVPEF